MLKRHAQLFENLFRVSDLLVVSISWLLSYWIRFSSGLLPVDKGVPPIDDYMRMLVFVWLIWAFVFRRFKLYGAMRGAGRLREVWRVVRANSFSVLFFVAMTYLFWEKSSPYSRLVFGIFWVVSTLSLIGARAAIRALLRLLRAQGYNLRYVLVVGAGELAEKVVQRIQQHPEFGFVCMGCLASDEAKGAAVSVGASENPGTRIVGTYSDLPRLLDVGGIDQVVVALPLSDHGRMEYVISLVGDSMVDVKIVPDLHQFIQLGSLVQEFDGLPVVSLASTPLTGFNRFLKRGLDIALGTLFFLLSLPVMFLLALLVKLTSRGPVLFSQERVGLDGRRFKIYKFRTMARDAERGGACFAVPADPRVTTIGKLLRKLSMDELPQLWNVIRGDMSLVGPRPERPVFIEEFRKHIPRYMLRHKVQAGMTGWAQVNGWRGNTSISKRIEHDLYYIEHWSLGLDLKILGLTLTRGFTDRNAY